MRRIKIALVLAVLAAAAVAGGASSDISVTTDTVVDLTGYTSIELLTLGGNATFKFMNGATPDTAMTRVGRANIVREFAWSYPAVMDSVLIDVQTSDEVIYSLE